MELREMDNRLGLPVDKYGDYYLPDHPMFVMIKDMFRSKEFGPKSVYACMRSSEMQEAIQVIEAQGAVVQTGAIFNSNHEAVFEAIAVIEGKEVNLRYRNYYSLLSLSKSANELDSAARQLVWGLNSYQLLSGLAMLDASTLLRQNRDGFYLGNDFSDHFSHNAFGQEWLKKELASSKELTYMIKPKYQLEFVENVWDFLMGEGEHPGELDHDIILYEEICKFKKESIVMVAADFAIIAGDVDIEAVKDTCEILRLDKQPSPGTISLVLDTGTKTSSMMDVFSNE